MSASRALKAWITTLIIITVCVLVSISVEPQVINYVSIYQHMLPSMINWAQWVHIIWNGCMFLCVGGSIIYSVIVSLSKESNSWLDDSSFGNI